MSSKKKSDIDPAFNFFVDTDTASPWELAGALADAATTRPGGTTVDDKIQRQLNSRKTAKHGGHRGNSTRAGAHAAGTGVNSADNDSSASELSEDALLDVEKDDSDDDVTTDANVASDGNDSEHSNSDVEKPGKLVPVHATSDDDDRDGGNQTDEQSDDEATLPTVNIDRPARTAQRAPLRMAALQQQPGQAQVVALAGNKRKRAQQELSQQGQEEAALADSDADEEYADVPRAERRDKDSQRKVKAKSAAYFAKTPEGTNFAASSFAELHLSRPLLKACETLGYTHPTPIQAACIPLALTGRDICGSAMTGSGKTAAFALPFLERLLHRSRRVLATYVLILTPTRELAVQIHSMVQKLAQFTDIRCAVVVGGLSLQCQSTSLRSNPEIVVATPGRLIDHVRNSASVGFEDLQVLVLDEADRLLEMGFAEELTEVVKMMPVKRQTLLFSATMTEQVKKLAAVSLRHPVRLAAHPTARTPDNLTHEVVRIKGSAVVHKEAVLLALASRSFSSGRTIVFFKTKHAAHRGKLLFGLGGLPPAAELHGNMSQSARLESLERFRKGEVAFLLCTDVAARGLDILGVDTVINYDAPATLTSYLHRVGRTARANSKGLAVTFIEDSDRQLLKQVIKQAKIQLQSRVPSSAAVKKWAAKIEDLETDIERIRQEEIEEREVRKAEMEAQKAENLVEHEAEIFSRPARTWFQTEKEKREIKERSKNVSLGKLPEAEAVEVASITSDKVGRSKKDKHEEKRSRKGKEDVQNKKNDPLIEETLAYSKNIRGAKSLEQQLRQQGLRPSQARKMAVAQLSTVKTSSTKKKAKQQNADTTAFDGDGVTEKNVNTRVYAGGAKSGALHIPSSKLPKRELNKLKRGGKGRHAFKSKARHKRR